MLFVNTLAASVRDYLQHVGQLPQNLIIRETNDTQVARGENAVAIPVVFFTGIVARAVHLNDNSGSGTVEVGDEAVDHLLSAKPEPPQLSIPQSCPEQCLLGRHGFAKLPGTLLFHHRDSLPNYDPPLDHTL